MSDTAVTAANQFLRIYKSINPFYMIEESEGPPKTLPHEANLHNEFWYLRQIGDPQSTEALRAATHGLLDAVKDPSLEPLAVMAALEPKELIDLLRQGARRRMVGFHDTAEHLQTLATTTGETRYLKLLKEMGLSANEEDTPTDQRSA